MWLNFLVHIFNSKKNILLTRKKPLTQFLLEIVFVQQKFITILIDTTSLLCLI